MVDLFPRLRPARGSGGIVVGAGGKSVAVHLFPSVTPGAIRGFLNLTRDNCCSNVVFRHIVSGFVVRNNSPAKANVNKSDV